MSARVTGGCSLGFSRRFRLTLLASVSALALTGGGDRAAGRSLQASGSSPAPVMPVQVPSWQATQAAQQAQNALARAAQAIRSLQASQDAARAAALAASSSVPNGLRAGGLQVAPGVAADPNLWQGANLPTQAHAGGRTQVEVKQIQQKAILTWNSFNIGRETDLYFNQTAGADKANTWIALNRVVDPSLAPSRILGTIKAEGQVYVINRNGIVFGGSSQVNVNTLVASSLSLSNEQFKNGIATMLFIDTGAGNGYALPTFGESAPNQNTRNYVPGYVPGAVSVEAGATVAAGAGGKIMIFGTTVRNSGRIQASDGQVILAAGEQVFLAANTAVRGLDVVTSAVPQQLLDGLATQAYSTDTPAVLSRLNARAEMLGFRVVNDGSVVAERGNITVHARTIEQNGELTATTALNNRGGSIRLQAWDGGTSQICSDSCVVGLTNLFSGTVRLGAGSTTSVVPDPVDTSLIEQSALVTRYEKSLVELRGKLIDIQDAASVIAPAGRISIVAAANARIGGEAFGSGLDTVGDGSRIYIGKDALLTTAGLLDVVVPMDRNIVKVELMINELQDSPLLRESFLRGQREIYVDRRATGRFTDGPMASVAWFSEAGRWYGSPLANLSGWLNNTKTDLATLSSLGGEIFIKAGGDVIARTGSLVDVSGGSIHYEGGIVRTTKLIGADGRLYDISRAMPDRLYVGIANGFTVNHAHWDVKEIYSGFKRSRYEAGYTEGQAAGSVKIYAGGGFALDGAVRGDVLVGERQRESNPKAGSVTFGGNADPERPYSPGTLLISASAARLPDTFTVTSAIGAAYFNVVASNFIQSNVTVSPDFVSNSGLATINFLTETKSTIAADAAIEMRPGALLNVGGKTVVIDGRLRIAGGSFSTVGLGRSTRLGAGAVIDLSGMWVNDTLGTALESNVAINGGTVALSNLDATRGAIIDVSGGGWVKSTAGGRGVPRIVVGDAGSIEMGAPVGFDVDKLDIRAYAAGSGGALRITPPAPISSDQTNRAAPNIQIGGARPSMVDTLYLPASLFGERGFSRISIDGRNIVIPDNVEVAPVAVGVELDPARAAKFATGGRIVDAGRVTVLAPEERLTRAAPSISLIASGSAFRGDGNVRIAQGAVLRGDTRAAISARGTNSLTVAGTIDAPAGRINLDGGPELLLTPQARLLSLGAAVISLDTKGNRVGSVLSGGNVGVAGDHVVLSEGALFDVSGTDATLDLPAPPIGLARTNKTVARSIAGDAGSISITVRNYGVVASTFMGRPGGAGAAGGSLSVSIQPNGFVSNEMFLGILTDLASFIGGSSWRDAVGINWDDFIGYGVPLIITHEMVDAVQAPYITVQSGKITQFPASDPLSQLGLTAEQLQYFNEGLGLDFAGMIRASETRITTMGMTGGGLDHISLDAPGRLVFEGDVTLQARASVGLSGSQFVKTNGGTAFVKANSVGLGGQGTVPEAPPSLAGRFEVDAGFINVSNFISSGIAETVLRSGGDMRVGELLHADGALTLQAAQVYPDTGLAATIESPVKVTILGSGPSRAPLSAGSSLTVQAPVIEQFGTLRAPTGTLTLKASEQLVLGEGSLTSVSAEGAIVPYGTTRNGDAWYYLGTLITAPPEKRVVLDAPSIQLRKGAVVDISGGGDLYASEFVPGPGGSRDLLAQSGAFAIIPGNASTAISGGDVIYLNGGNGLAAGLYTVLPASYALLPGAYLVTTYGAASPTGRTASGVLADGTLIMGGRLGNVVAGTQAQLDRNWRVMPGSTLRSYSEYIESTANTFFASEKFKLSQYRQLGRDITTVPRLPLDGGTLALKAQQDLLLEGVLRSQAGAGGRGGLVDIAAQKIAVVGAGQDGASLRAQGYLVVDSSSLSNFGAASLLLGGTRSGDIAGVRVDVAASDIVVRNDEAHALTGAEIILAARERLTVDAGSVIVAEGALQADSGDLLITPQVAKVVNADGTTTITPARDWGALLRVSNGVAVAVRREGAEQSNGVLTIGAGVVLRGGAALTLDATKDTILASTARLSGADVSIASGRIGVGGGTSGLVIGAGALGDLAAARRLALVSYSTIDFYDGARIAGGALEQLTLDAAALVGYGSGAVVLEGKRVQLVNNGRTFSEPTGVGTGTLTITGNELVLGAGVKSLRGFTAVSLEGRDVILGQGTGGIEAAAANLTLVTPVMTGRGSAQQSIRTTGALALSGSGTGALGNDTLGSRFDLVGGTVSIASTIGTLGGIVTVTATAGDIVVANGGNIDVGGMRKEFFDVAMFGPAGRIALTSQTGSVRVLGGARINVAGHADGGDGGQLDVAALGGTFDLAGMVAGGAAAGSRSGAFTLDAAAVPNFGGLSQQLNAAGFFEARAFRIRAGDVVLDGVTQSRQFAVQADQGSVTIVGTIDASSSRSGLIEISARRNLTMLAGAKLLAGNTGEFGSSRVLLETQGEAGGILSIQGGVIDVTSPEGGRVVFRAPQTAAGDDVAIGMLGARIAGSRESLIEGFRSYTSATTEAVRVQAVADALAFATHATAIQARLGRSDLAVAPGIEIRSAGELTVDGSWNLLGDFPTLRQGGLTLRAAGNLIVANNLSDGFSAADPSGLLQDGLSWNLRLVAGADLDAASALGVMPRASVGASGSVIVGADGAPALVRTGSGDINLRAANGLTLADTASVIYTAGSLDTTVLPGFTPSAGAYYARYGGNLSIAVGGDIVSVPTEQFFSEWLWHSAQLDDPGMAYFVPGGQPTWGVRHERFRQGVGVLGGGDVTVKAGGNIVELSVMQPTMGRVQGGRTASEARTAVIQNGGLMTVSAGGDIRGGMFYAGRGEATISAAALTVGRTITHTQGSDVTSYDIAPILALGDTVMNVSSAGSITIQTALEPLLTRTDPANAGGTLYNPGWLTYTERTALSLMSTGGNVSLVNQTLFLFTFNGYEPTPPVNAGAIYPSKLVIAALNGSIASTNGLGVASGDGVVMAPGRSSNLMLIAERDVLFSDISESRLPLSLLITPTYPLIASGNLKGYLRSGPRETDNPIINALANPDVLDLVDDYEPTRIYARTGSIEHPYARAGSSIHVSVRRMALLFSNEQVWLRAGRDIRGVDLNIRNNHLSDVSLLEAGNDVLMTRAGGDSSFPRISVRGPGAIVIQAGRDIFFERGGAFANYVETVGNYLYTNADQSITVENGLPAGGADIVMLAGIRQQPNYAGFMAAYLDPANVAAMPDYLRRVGGAANALMPSYFIDWVDEQNLTHTGLASYVVAKTGNAALRTAPADVVWQAFRALPTATQNIFIDRVLAYEIRATNRANAGLPLSEQIHTRGYEAIATLFPGDNWKGSIINTNNRIETMRGGDILMLVPGGGVQVAALGATVEAGAGIITGGSGDINIISRDSIVVNRSRVLTFEGGDMIIGTPEGDIDSGRGAKTSRSALAPEVFIDVNGNTLVRERADKSGSGIGTVQSFSGVKPGDLDLWAPRGIVNAGDAGIRVSGNFYVAAIQVLGTQNIDVKGEVKGVPKEASTVNLKSDGNQDKTASDVVKATTQVGQQDKPSIIIVEVLGYGGASEPDQNAPRPDDADKRRSQDPSSAVQVIGAGPLTEREKLSLTEDEKRKLTDR